MTLDSLLADVRHNCEITNAKVYSKSKFGFTECYKLDKNLKFWQDYNYADYQKWLGKKSILWQSVKNQDYRKVEPLSGLREGIFIHQYNAKPGILTSHAFVPVEVRSRDGANVYVVEQEKAIDSLSLLYSFCSGNNLVIRLFREAQDVVKSLNFLRKGNKETDMKALEQALLDFGFLQDEICGKQFAFLENKIKSFSKKISKNTENHEFGHWLTKQYLKNYEIGSAEFQAQEMIADAVSTLPEIIADKDELLYNSWAYYHFTPDFDSEWPNLRETYKDFPRKIDWHAIEAMRQKIHKQCLQVLQSCQHS